jgi:hypothetical protein
MAAMTVEELIAELRKYNPKAKVWVSLTTVVTGVASNAPDAEKTQMVNLLQGRPGI